MKERNSGLKYNIVAIIIVMLIEKKGEIEKKSHIYTKAAKFEYISILQCKRIYTHTHTRARKSRRKEEEEEE